MSARDLNEYESKAIELGLRPTKLFPLRKKIQETADAVLSPSIHAKRFELAIDKILSTSKKYKFDSAKEQHRVPKKAENKSLEDFTLVMIRPRGVSNWAYNVSMLADELEMHGGHTIVIDNQIAKKKGSNFPIP